MSSHIAFYQVGGVIQEQWVEERKQPVSYIFRFIDHFLFWLHLIQVSFVATLSNRFFTTSLLSTIQADGMGTSQWLTSLSQFTGSLVCLLCKTRGIKNYNLCLRQKFDVNFNTYLNLEMTGV